MTGGIRGKLEVFLRNEFAGRGIVIRILIIGFLLAISYVFLFPLMKMLSMSFMSEKDLINPEIDWIPIHVSFKSFRVAAKVLDTDLRPTGRNRKCWLSRRLILKAAE